MRGAPALDRAPAAARRLRDEEQLGPAAIARRLGIGRASVYRVLGAPPRGRTTHHAWRGRPAESYTTDRLLRLSLVLGIYGLLQRLHGEAPAYADAWVHAPNRARPFAGRAPLELVREEGLPGLLLVRRVLEATAGGGLVPLVPVDAMAWEGEGDVFPSQRPAPHSAHAGAPDDGGTADVARPVVAA